MEIRYPDPDCKYSPTGAHHYLVLYGGIWRCKHCWTPAWFPKDFSIAASFSYSVDKLGLQTAYSRSLSIRPKTAMIIKKLEKIRLLRDKMDEDDFLEAVADIISAKELELVLTEDSNVKPGRHHSPFSGRINSQLDFE